MRHLIILVVSSPRRYVRYSATHSHTRLHKRKSAGQPFEILFSGTRNAGTVDIASSEHEHTPYEVDVDIYGINKCVLNDRECYIPENHPRCLTSRF
jgi:hypothetical protein